MKIYEMSNETDGEFINPIDKDKVAEFPSILPYAHTVGGSVIKPIDKGRTKGLAVSAMYEQTEMQLDQIRQQINLLAEQAGHIKRRVQVSEDIYNADMNFKPLIGHTYHLYKNKQQKLVLSMIGPQEWGRSKPYEFQATVKLLADHTWDILDQKPNDLEKNP